ncbi:MAG TPA: hypothetical protein VIE37_01050 [Methylomirabilota bacterium]|jgi:hypothetical protein
MADNWSFVVAAYGLAALALGGYWRFLRRRERELQSEGPSGTKPSRSQDSGGNAAARKDQAPVR